MIKSEHLFHFSDFRFSLNPSSCAPVIFIVPPSPDTMNSRTHLGPLAHFPSAFALIVVAFFPVHRLFDSAARPVRYSGSVRILTVHVSSLHRYAKWKTDDSFKNLNIVKYLCGSRSYTTIHRDSRAALSIHIILTFYFTQQSTYTTYIIITVLTQKVLYRAIKILCRSSIIFSFWLTWNRVKRTGYYYIYYDI